MGKYANTKPEWIMVRNKFCFVSSFPPFFIQQYPVQMDEGKRREISEVTMSVELVHKTMEYTPVYTLIWYTAHVYKIILSAFP